MRNIASLVLNCSTLLSGGRSSRVNGRTLRVRNCNKWLLAALLIGAAGTAHAEQLNESFESAAIPAGWQVVTPEGNLKSWNVAEKKSDAHSAPYCAVAPEAKSDMTNETYLITPRLAPEDGESLTFWMRTRYTGSGTTTIQVEVSTTDTDPASFTTLETYMSFSAKAIYFNQNWKQFTIDMSAYKDRYIYIAFHSIDESENEVYLDDISGVTLKTTCPKPGAPVVTATTPTSTNLAWTKGDREQKWYLRYKKSSATEWSEPIVVNGTPACTLNTVPGTSYDVRIVADCGDDMLSDFAESTFSSYCEPISTLPWQSEWAGVVGYLPVCYKEWHHSARYNAPFVDESNAIKFRGNNIKALAEREQRSLLILPQGTMDIRTLAISMEYKTAGIGKDYPTFRIGYIEAGDIDSRDVEKFHSLDTLPQTDNTYTRSVPFTLSAAPEGAYITICYNNPIDGPGSYYDGYIRSILIEDANHCTKPATPVVSAITGTTAHVEWPTHEGVVYYQYCLVPAGQSADWSSEQLTTDNFINLKGLTDKTNYDFYVRCFCGSEASDACSFKTAYGVPAPSMAELKDVEATISWESTTALEYRYIAVAKDAAPDWSEAKTTTELSVTLTELQARTAYDFYVRAIYAETNTTSKAFSFTTEAYQPQNLAMTDLSDQTVSFAWEKAGAANGYQYLVLNRGNEPDWAQATMLGKEVLSLTHKDLGANMPYSLFIRSYYTDGIYSDPIQLDFNTLCGPSTIPYTQNFGSTSSAPTLPTCWVINNWNSDGNAGTWYVYKGEGAKDGYSLRFNAKNAPATGYAVMPEIIVSDSATLKFYIKNRTSNYEEYYRARGRVHVSNRKDTTTLNWDLYNDYTQLSMDLSEFIGDTVTIAFEADAISNPWADPTVYLWLDDITVRYVPVAKPTNVTALATEDGALVTWESAQGVSWKYRYREKDSGDDWTTGTSNSKSLKLSGLEEMKTYEIQVMTYCSQFRESDWTESVTFMPKACPGVASTKLTDGTHNAVTLNWQLSYAHDVDIRYKANNAEDWTLIANVASTESSKTFNGLTTDMKYSFQIKATCADDLAWTNAGSYTPIYNAPTYLFVSGDDTEADVIWHAPDAGAATLTGYEMIAVKWKAEQDWSHPTLFAADRTRDTIRGLQPDMNYDGYLRAVYDDGGRSQAIKCNFGTHPSFPSHLTVDTVSYTTATFSWKQNMNDYRYDYTLSEGEAKADWNKAVLLDHEQRTVTVEGLTRGVAYTFYVRSHYDNGAVSDYPVSAYFMTWPEELPENVIPWTEGFEDHETGSMPAGWSTLNLNIEQFDGKAEVDNASKYVQTGSKSLHFTGRSGTVCYAIFPTFETPFDTLQMSFSHKEENANKSAVLTIGYMTNTAKAETFVPIREFTRSTSWQTEKDILLNVIPKGIKARLAFRFGTSPGYETGIDDITIEYLDHCKRPENVAVKEILPDGATISWECPGDVWEYACIDKNAIVTNWTKVLKREVTIHDKALGTEYDFYVRTWCSNEQQSKISKVSFIPAVLTPTNLQVSDIEKTTATLSWNAVTDIPQYQYVITRQGQAPDWDEAQLTASTSVNLTERLAGYRYDAYVRSYYKEDAQSEASKTSFQMDCAPLALPWYEDFEDHDMDQAPMCWDVLDAQTADPYTYPYVGIVNNTHQKGTRSLYMEAKYTEGYVIFPEFAQDLSGATISYARAIEWYHSGAYSELGYITDINDAATFVGFHTTGTDAEFGYQWRNEPEITIPVLPVGARLAFRFWNTEIVSLGAFVDEISITSATPTGMENGEWTMENGQWTKLLHNGVLYIIRDGKTYNVQGQIVK